jgi:hypothetical protein
MPPAAVKRRRAASRVPGVAPRKKAARAPVVRRAPARTKVKGARAAAPTAAPRPPLRSEAAVSGELLLFVTLAGLGGLLLITAAAVPPARVPWPVIGKPLYTHRSNLAVIGMGTIAVALICLNLAVL